MKGLILLCFLFIMVGCDSYRQLSGIEPSSALTQAKETIVPEKTSIDMDQLFQKKPSGLRIQVKGEASLDTNSLLLDKIWNLLKQSNKLPAGAAYNDVNFDPEEVDLSLKFSGYKRINLNTKYNYFNFDGETTIYELPFGSSYKWGHMTKGNTVNGLEYIGFVEKILSQQEVDLDGNGSKEKINLVYDGDLELRINGLSETVYPNLEDVDAYSYTIMDQKPKISIQSPSEGTHKKMVISMVWATNMIGSTVEMWVYEYRNKHMKRIWQLADEKPKAITTYNGNRKITVEIPEYHLQQKLMISGENNKRISKSVSPKQILNQKDLIDLATTTEYFINDLDGDGYQELVTKRITYIQGSYYFEPLYTLFKFNDRNLIPAKALFVDGIKQAFIEEIVQGKPIVLERKNTFIKYLIEAGSTYEKIIKSYEEMIKDGWIVKGPGNKYSL